VPALRLHRRLVYCLGLVVGLEKNSPWPSQLVTYLGFLHALAQGRLLLPQDKLERFQAGIIRPLQGLCPTLHHSLVGQLASFRPALQEGPLLTRALIAEAEGTGSSELEYLHRPFWDFWQAELPRNPWAAHAANTAARGHATDLCTFADRQSGQPGPAGYQQAYTHSPLPCLLLGGHSFESVHASCDVSRSFVTHRTGSPVTCTPVQRCGMPPPPPPRRPLPGPRSLLRPPRSSGIEYRSPSACCCAAMQSWVERPAVLANSSAPSGLHPSEQLYSS
jgi:hypothetical protein